MVPFKPSDHLEEINGWLTARGLPPVHHEELPIMGYIIQGVAAGFLRRCEGNVAIIDSLITNPSALPSDRNSALNAIYEQLLKDSSNLGIRRVMGFTVDDHTLHRSIQHGFTPYACAVLVQELKCHF